jgi:TusA-related sulfurtransferase
MGEIQVVDARGLSCPQPALLAHQAIQKLKKGEFEVLVDSGTARDNVSRLARNAGWTVTIEDMPGGTFRLVAKK